MSLPTGKIEIRQCAQCGNDFESRTSHQVCCSSKCRNERNRPKYKDWAKAYNAKYRAANAPSIRQKIRAKRKTPGESIYRNWYAAVRRKAYTGTLEEWAYYREQCAIEAHGAKQAKAAKREASEAAIKSSPTYGMTEAESYKYWYDNDPAFRAWERQRNQFKKWLKGERRSKPLSLMLGYTRQQLVEHLEAQFQRGMSWDNMGEWHIDHIVPKNLFDPAQPTDVEACWSLSNLRPLWASDNVRRPKDGSDVLL